MIFKKHNGSGGKRISKFRIGVGIIVLIITMTLAILFASGGLRNFAIFLNSMQPTIKPGERVIVDARSSYHPAVGDVVAVINPREDTEWFCKRVVAGPGDSVEFRVSHLFVNGQYRNVRGLDEPEIHRFDPRMVINPYAYKIELKDGEYFVLGDNIDVSYDSRYFGPVKRKDIIGNVLFVYWPWENRRKIEPAVYHEQE